MIRMRWFGGESSSVRRDVVVVLSCSSINVIRELRVLLHLDTKLHVQATRLPPNVANTQ